MAQPTIKRPGPPLPTFLATADGNAETDGSTAETSAETVQEAAPIAEEPNLLEPQAPMSDIDDHALTVKDQINRLDMERLEVAAQLVNTFNRAIQVQAGRNEWTAHDYAAFIVALRSVDRIGYDAQQAVKKA